MKRDLAGMASREYDLVVVGGGITGACVARDAALRGLSVALVEKADFAGATSAASSKLIHGGLRYLRNLELGLVRESLRERRIWSNIAPHMIDPLAIIMPTMSASRRRRMADAIGLRVYDLLAYDRNRLDDPEKAIPAHKRLSRAEALAMEPTLEPMNPTGALVFYDYQMYSPERLALECVLSATEQGADVANYAETVGFTRGDDGAITGVRVADRAPNARNHGETDEHLIRGRMIINATGPWADLLMNTLHDGEAAPAPRRMIRSKGIHLITRPITRGHAVAVSGEKTHFFILPWRGYSLLGTTDTVYDGDPDNVHATEKDIVDFLAVINKGYPAANLVRSDVLYFYAGLRPLIDTAPPPLPGGEEDDAASPDTYKASRAAEVYDHEQAEGLRGLITAIGGKWTTSRGLAEKVVDLALKKLDMPPRPCLTADTPTYGGAMERFTEFTRDAIARHPDHPPALIEHIARNYGSRMEDVMALIRQDPALAEPLCPGCPDVAAQVVHAVRREMALRVDDVLVRRTGLGATGAPAERAFARIADIMRAELAWTDERRDDQIAQAVSRFVSWARTTAIVNPKSWGARTGDLWPRIEARLRRAIGPIDVKFTDAPMAAQRIAAEALEKGMEQIIAVGGDGTVNEVVNGFFKDGKPINPEAILAVLTSGTGRDFSRTFGMPEDVFEQVEQLATSEVRPIDLGRLTFVNDAGEEETRYFNNIASFGLSGATDRVVNRLTWGKRFGGKFAFKWALVKALLGYRNQRVRLVVDDEFDRTLLATTVAVCNGQFFGASMHMAPDAKPDDGLFDIVIMENVGKIELLLKSNRVYRGEHIHDAKATVLRGKRVVATPAADEGPVLLDIDGEAPGRLPATFEVLPGALYLRY